MYIWISWFHLKLVCASGFHDYIWISCVHLDFIITSGFPDSIWNLLVHLDFMITIEFHVYTSNNRLQLDFKCLHGEFHINIVCKCSMPFQTIHIYCVSVQKFYTSKNWCDFQVSIAPSYNFRYSTGFLCRSFYFIFCSVLQKNTITTNYEGLWA